MFGFGLVFGYQAREWLICGAGEVIWEEVTPAYRMGFK